MKLWSTSGISLVNFVAFFFLSRLVVLKSVVSMRSHARTLEEIILEVSSDCISMHVNGSLVFAEMSRVRKLSREVVKR